MTFTAESQRGKLEPSPASTRCPDTPSSAPTAPWTGTRIASLRGDAPLLDGAIDAHEGTARVLFRDAERAARPSPDDEQSSHGGCDGLPGASSSRPVSDSVSVDPVSPTSASDYPFIPSANCPKSKPLVLGPAGKIEIEFYATADGDKVARQLYVADLPDALSDDAALRADGGPPVTPTKSALLGSEDAGEAILEAWKEADVDDQITAKVLGKATEDHLDLLRSSDDPSALTVFQRRLVEVYRDAAALVEAEVPGPGSCPTDDPGDDRSLDAGGPRCPHYLNATKPNGGWFNCDECGASIPKRSTFQFCESCNYSCCYPCWRTTPWTQRAILSDES